MIRQVRIRRFEAEDGIGLIELLISLTILVIGVAATLAVFSSSITGLQHTGQEGTALTLADRQLESYRAMPYACIPPSTMTAPTGCLTPSGFPNPYAASQVTTSADSPDHKLYAVTTTVATAAGSGVQISVSVALNSGGPTLAKESSYFSAAGTSANG